jgi:vitamin B12 transporter
VLRWSTCVAAGWVLVHVIPALGEDALQLPEVVVTGQRNRTGVEESSTAVTIVDGNDVNQRDQDKVSDAVRGTPGVDVTEFGSPGASTFVTIRGALGDEVAVRLDGVEVNNTTEGQYDFANLTTLNLDRIEIVRGGAGAAYGPEAIGGTVNVATRRGEGPFHLLSSGEAGSAATHHETLGINGACGPFALSGTAAYLASDGFQPINDDYRNFSTVWRSDLDVLPTATLRTFLRYTESRKGLVNFNITENELDPNAYTRDDFFLSKGEWEHAPTDAFNYRATVSWVRNNPRVHDDTVENGQVVTTVNDISPGEETAAEWQANYRWPAFARSTIGFEYKEQWADFMEFPGEDESPQTSDVRANRSSYGAYAQERFQLLDDTLDTAAGLRSTYYDGFGNHVTLSASTSYLVQPTQTRLRLGFNEGYRPPAFDELFGVLGNETLQAESSYEIDAGFTQDLLQGMVSLVPTYFFRKTQNLIEDIAELPPVSGEPEDLHVHTVGTVAAQGVELALLARPTHWCTLATNYTYLNTLSTEALLNRPRHRGSVIAAGQWDNVVKPADQMSATAMVQAVGRRDSPNPFNTEEPFAPRSLTGYARVDLALAYRFGGDWSALSLTTSVRNLFNRTYSESIGFPAPPANALAGFRYGF